LEAGCGGLWLRRRISGVCTYALAPLAAQGTALLRVAMQRWAQLSH